MRGGQKYRFGSPQRNRTVTAAFVVPALRKVREERGTHFIADAGEIKSLGHPPEPRCAVVPERENAE